jgi:hypothetical protein
MNVILAITLGAAGIFAAAGLVTFTLVIAGIHGEERRMNLAAQPATRAEVLGRRVMDVRVSQADARRIFASRHAGMASQAYRPRPPLSGIAATPPAYDLR